MGVPFFVGVRWVAGGQRRPPLRKCILRCVGEGLCPSRGRGNRRSAASGGCSEPVSRKRPDWRTRQRPSVGWHDGGQEDPARVTRSAVQRGIPQTRRCRVSFPYAGESLGRGCGCPCCGAQNFCAALRRTLEILTAATRSPRFLCHWQRSPRSPRALCAPAMTAFFHEEGNGKRPAWAGRGIPYAFQLSVRWRHSSS